MNQPNTATDAYWAKRLPNSNQSQRIREISRQQQLDEDRAAHEREQREKVHNRWDEARQLLRFKNSTKIRMADIMWAYRRHGSFSWPEITSKNKDRRIMLEVHAIMSVARKHTTLSFPQIGQMLGDRHHSTVLHGVGKVSANPERYAALIEKMERALNVWASE